jgi:hypothetical protein
MTRQQRAVSLAPRGEPPRDAHELGRVVASEGDAWVIQSEQGEQVARRALSCLLEPQVDDLVLVAKLDNGRRSYLIAVLERARAGEVHIAIDVDTELVAVDGTLSVRAPKGIRLASTETIGLVGRAIHLMADDGTLLVRSLSVLSDTCRVHASHITLLANVIESIAERVSSYAQRVLRRTEELEQIQAGELQVRAAGNLDVRGRNALLSAQQLVKLNGEQVHLG